MTPEALHAVRLAFAALGAVVLVLFAYAAWLGVAVDRLRGRVARLEGAAGDHSPESSPPRPR